MGRACMSLWTDLHFVLKAIVVALMVTVEFLVFDVTTKQYHRFLYLQAYYFIVLSYLIIVLYGYTWFDVAKIWEMLIVTISAVMLAFAAIVYIQDYNSQYVVDKQGRDQFLIFIILTLLAFLFLIIDMVLLILGALGKGPSFAKRGDNDSITPFAVQIMAVICLQEVSKYNEYSIPRWLWVIYCIDSLTYSIIYISIGMAHVFEKPRKLPELVCFSLGVVFNMIGGIAGIERSRNATSLDSETHRSEFKIGLLLLANSIILFFETANMVCRDVISKMQDKENHT